MAVPAHIEQYLREQGVRFEALTHRQAFTAQEEAAAAHVRGREWAKTVVCFADDEPIQAVLPAPYHVDLGRLRALSGASLLRFATEAEMAKLYPESEPGAEPPFGPMYGQRVFVERVLTEDQEIVFNAGTHRDAVRMRFDDFKQLARPTIGDFGVKVGQP